MPTTHSLVLASNNRHKAAEYARILAPRRILLPADVGVDFSHAEGESTFWANALGKALALHVALSDRESPPLPVLADDSGLCVAALDGAPGVHSNRFGATEAGLLTAEQKNDLLLRRLRGAADRSAFFVCAAVVLLSPERYFLAQETFTGRIATTPSGSRGFGYDPVFVVPRLGCTVAGLDEETKDRYSHRGRAGRRMAAVLDSLDEEP